MDLLLTNIQELVRVATDSSLIKKGAAMRDVGVLRKAWLHISEGKIAAMGSMDEMPTPTGAFNEMNCAGRVVMPGFVDSHTHLMYVSNREPDFVQYLQGNSYAAVQDKGGGIQASAAEVVRTSDDELLAVVMRRIWELMQSGTTTLEIKSGYGLWPEQELRILRLMRELRKKVPLNIRTTLLAHAVPTEYRQNRPAYIDLFCNELIPQAQQEGLIDYVDVFCESGFFSPGETERILTTAQGLGLSARNHANSFELSVGVQVGVKCKVVSVDNLSYLGEAEINAIARSEVIPTLLPAVSFFMGTNYAPARRLIDVGKGIAIASGCNPGTAPLGQMPFILGLSCAQLRLQPEEAITAMTLNAAAALQWSDRVGSIEVGKQADLIVTEPLSSYQSLPFQLGHNPVEKVIISGKVYK